MSIETMTKIGTYTVNTVGGEASVTFNNIPQDYNDLVVKASLRSERAASLANPVLTINGDTTSTYYRKELYAEGSTGGEYVNDRAIGGMPAASIAANVFGNLDLYISNYSGNFWKNYNFDTGSPSTTTSNYSIWSGSTLYYNTAPVTSLTFTINGGANYSRYSTFTLYGVKNARKTIGNSIKATGGIVSFDGTYVYHTFTTSGLFYPRESLIVDCLLVAGGGGGGGDVAGGGGAGGLLLRNLQGVSPQSYSVIVGAGGSSQSTVGAQGVNGSDSGALSFTATGGGGGGGSSTNTGRNGGSGGGGGTGGSIGTGISGQGNNGGAGYLVDPFYNGGGGGGWSAAGVAATASLGGSGGSGYTNNWGAGPNQLAGGGGGGWLNNTGGTGSLSNRGVGVFGGGGGGVSRGSTTIVTASPGIQATGGGGGGGGWQTSSNQTGAQGGSGLVIIRYKA